MVSGWWLKYKPCRGLPAPTSPLFFYTSNDFLKTAGSGKALCRVSWQAVVWRILWCLFSGCVRRKRDISFWTPDMSRKCLTPCTKVFYSLCLMPWYLFEEEVGIGDIVAQAWFPPVLVYSAVLLSAQMNCTQPVCPGWCHYCCTSCGVGEVKANNRAEKNLLDSKRRAWSVVKVAYPINVNVLLEDKAKVREEKNAAVLARDKADEAALLKVRDYDQSTLSVGQRVGLFVDKIVSVDGFVLVPATGTKRHTNDSRVEKTASEVWAFLQRRVRKLLGADVAMVDALIKKRRADFFEDDVDSKVSERVSTSKRGRDKVKVAKRSAYTRTHSSQATLCWPVPVSKGKDVEEKPSRPVIGEGEAKDGEPAVESTVSEPTKASVPGDPGVEDAKLQTLNGRFQELHENNNKFTNQRAESKNANSYALFKICQLKWLNAVLVKRWRVSEDNWRRSVQRKKRLSRKSRWRRAPWSLRRLLTCVSERRPGSFILKNGITNWSDCGIQEVACYVLEVCSGHWVWAWRSRGLLARVVGCAAVVSGRFVLGASWDKSTDCRASCWSELSNLNFWHAPRRNIYGTHRRSG